jgi:hypothetical protein
MLYDLPTLLVFHIYRLHPPFFIRLFMLRTLSTRQQRPVAHLLTGLFLACLLPGILGSALFLLNEYRDERGQQNEKMLQLARDMGQAVDTHLLRAQTLARSLSSVQQRAGGDADLFSPQGVRLIAAALGNPVVLYRADGTGFSGIASRGGQPLPDARQVQAIRTVLSTRSPVIGNIATDALQSQFPPPS